MKKLLFFAVALLSAVSTFAQFSPDKVYTIVNNNDANCYMQDNGNGVVATGNKNDNSYWKFVSTENADCYYIQNATTGKYIQGYSASEQEVGTGDAGVEYYVKADASGSYEGKYRMSCTANSPHDFSSGTLGLNWKGNIPGTVQGFASVAGGNPRSAWIVTEATKPEPEPEPEPVVLSSPWVGNALATGEFYLYNVESGLWLQNNDSKASDWSTRAAIGTRGLDFAIAGADDSYTIGANFGSTSINPDNNYLDTGNNPAWTFEAVEKNGVSNAYKIYCGNKVLGTVCYTENGKQDNLFTQEGEPRWYLENPDYNVNMTERNTWQLVTKAERLAKMEADASIDTPQDATWLIPSADFANNDRRYNLWTRTLNGGNGRKGDGNGINGSMCIESWNSGSIDFSITIADVPNGTYHLTVQGYYRDGNFEDVATRRDNGTETIRSFYFANEVSHPLMSILDEAKDAEVAGAWARNNNGRWYPDSQNSANKCFNLHKGYVNPEIEVVVTTGILKIGIKKSEGVSNDWTVFDNFKLTYYGNNIDLSDFINALNAAIESAEAFNQSSTSTILANILNDAIEAAKAKLTSNDSNEIVAAQTSLEAALDAAKAVNVSVLKTTAALAQAEGVDVTAANTVIAEATTMESVNAALDALRIARKINALGGAADIYTGSVPAANTEYYFFNLGTGMWLSAGSDWNTHAAVDQAGWLFKLNESGEGFSITCSMGSFNNSPYVDTGANTVYTFQAVEGKENVYNILEGSDLLGWNPQGKTDGKKYWNSVSNVSGADAADANYQWKLVTKAERDALIATATEASPVDATYLINNPSLLRKPGYDMWKKEVDGGNGGARVSSKDDGNGERAADYGWEYYNTNSFKFYQEIEGLMPGIYEVSATAFYRDGDGGYQANVFNNDGELLQLAYLFANDQQTPLPNIATVRDMVPGVASQGTKDGNFVNWPAEVFEYFETGYYKTTVQVAVGADGKLSLGIAKDSKANGGDWVVLDNFRLTCLGLTDYVTVGENLYATYVAPFDVDFTGAEVSAFAALKTKKDNYTYVDLKPVTTVPAGTAVVVTADVAGSYPVAKTTDAELGQENDLIAVTGEVVADGTQYILANGTKGVGFYKAQVGTPLAVGKGYLEFSGEAAVKGFYGFNPEDATGIETIDNGQQTTDNVIYNVAGQRLNKMQKGVNIMNSKKILK